MFSIQQYDWQEYPDIESLVCQLEGEDLAFGNGKVVRRLIPILLESDIHRMGALFGPEGYTEATANVEQVYNI